jgi:hypothetical protein
LDATGIPCCKGGIDGQECRIPQVDRALEIADRGLDSALPAEGLAERRQLLQQQSRDLHSGHAVSSKVEPARFARPSKPNSNPC